MNSVMFLFSSAGQQAGDGSQQGDGGFSLILMIVVMFVIMYFFMIRPQNKKRKEIMKFQQGLQVGQEVITASGVYGKVKNLNPGESYVEIEIAKDITIKVDRSYIFNASDPNRQMQS